MQVFKQIICPVSPERIDENVVRLTALWVVLSMGTFFMTGISVIPLLISIDFFIRAFTQAKISPFSRLSKQIVAAMGLNPVLIDKGPKIFAARIGFILTILTTSLSLSGLQSASVVTGSILVLFAFLECGLNFCAGCWLYTFLVYPLVRKNQ